MLRIPAAFILVLVMTTAVAGQSTAINGTIEGTVKDDQGGVLPGVTVTVTNVDTGDTRTVVTNESGLYRAPLLPLGTYRVAAELQGFKKFEQTGITLRAGQAAVIDVGLSVGTVQETVTVTGDAPLVDLGKIEQGRTLSEAEIKTLPLTSRNPYNFALLQPGVVGFENQEFGVPRITSNGALLRVNYQIDGSNNTQKDRAGLRQMPMSEVMIREVKVVTTGYAPEFGQTMGLIYNAITPSGTNTLKGQASYRLQRESFAAFPFFTQNRSEKPPTDVNVTTVDVGGPIVTNRTHFFGGYEHTERDLSGARVITISPADQAALGLNEPTYMPAALNTEFAIGKVDHQVNSANRLSVRYIFFDNVIPFNTGGGLNSVQRGTDFTDRQHSTAAQLVSTIGQNVLNELRVQYATRAQSRVAGALSPTGPAINIPQVANFGNPIADDSAAGFEFTQDVLQVNDNLTFIRGDHAYKFGFDVQHVADNRTRTASQLYTFPNVNAYLVALNGTNRFSYTSFTQYFGDPNLEYNSNLYGLYVQDDWRISDRVKVLYGIRYDLYDVPEPNPDAPFEASRDFRIDQDNWGPRVGVVWTLGANRRSVIRANTGIMYDQAILAAYEQALINDGTSRRASATFSSTTVGAPAFPNVFTSGTGTTNTLTTVSSDFQVARNWQNNLQFEHQLSDKYAVAIGTSYAKGYDLPVITNINPINPIGTLPDGRPIFSQQVNANTRRDPRYNVINMVESVGDSTYRNLTLQLTGRNISGVQFDLAYTLAKAEDNAPITSVLSVQGDQGGRSDPTDLERDRGPNILDQRHTFVGSIVATPNYGGDNAIVRGLVNGTVFGVALQFASGVPINLRSNLDLNNDSVLMADRPNGVGRNSLNLPARYNVDLRLSRQVPVGRTKAEVIGELKNVFNTVQWSTVNNVITTDALGNPTSPLPTSGDQLPPTGGYEQRQFQLGFRFVF
jgi:hypothetical protein